MKDIEISFDGARVTAENLADLFEEVGFGSAAEYLNIASFRDKFVGADARGVFAIEKQTDQLVGFARVFTDEIFATHISELCVRPNKQKQGIGSALVRAITERFGHTAIYAEAFSQNTAVFEKYAIVPRASLVACSRAPQGVSPVLPQYSGSSHQG
ncbi:MAG: GNAT family N-acetyltransferase [Janthinobacterium lividum]